MIPTPDKWSQFSVLIPFHHRHDLLFSLLKSLQGIPVLVVDDGPVSSFFAADIQCVRSDNVGFSKAVNHGLQYLEKSGIKTVLLLNDDAQISIADIKKMLDNYADDKILSPVIQCKGQKIYGATVQKWGRIKANHTKPDSIDAVYGTCMLLPSSVRFDEGYRHGFEDIELCLRLKREGYQLILMDSIHCEHVGSASLSANTELGQRSATYGHLRLFSSLKKAPVISSLSLLQIIREKGNSARYIGFMKGVLDWLYRDVPSLAVRRASSNAGSNKAK